MKHTFAQDVLKKFKKKDLTYNELRQHVNGKAKPEFGNSAASSAELRSDKGPLRPPSKP